MAIDTRRAGAAYEFGLLGPLEVRSDGVALALGGRQQRAILALLLVSDGRPVSLDRIADELWGEKVPASYQTTVQTYVFHLREILEPERTRGTRGALLVREGAGYRLLTDSHTVDARQFADAYARARSLAAAGDPTGALEQFDHALGLWRGEVLADLDAFRFVQPVATRLGELRVAAEEARIDARLALGQHADAVSELEELIARHPLHERFHCQRMLTLYRLGRQGEALAGYRALRDRLGEELGIEPGPAAARLHQQILEQDPLLLEPLVTSGDVVDTHAPAGTDTDAGPTMGVDIAAGAEAAGPSRPPSQKRRLSRRVLAVSGAVVLLLAIAGTGLAVKLRGTGLASLPSNSVGWIDDGGQVHDAIGVGHSPSGLAFADGSLWATNLADDSVSRIDPASARVVQTIPDIGPRPQAIAGYGTDVWVAVFGGGQVVRINATSNTVTDRISVGAGPAALAVAAGSIWVANSEDNTVQRLDPSTDHVDPPLRVGAGPDGLAVGGDTLWVANGRDRTVQAIDIRTGEPARAPILVGAGPRGLAIDGDTLWVANHLSGSVSRVSTKTGSMEILRVGEGPNSLAVGQDAVWVTDEFAGTMSRIDKASNEVSTYPMGSSARGVVAVEGRTWLAGAAFADPTHVGGTLVVAEQALPFNYTADVAREYSSRGIAVTQLVNDHLVAYRKTGGLDGQTLVPDLAEELPVPSDDGRTYTFTIRSGIRYSTGAPLRASDFVLGFQRVLDHGGDPNFFAGIVGAQACLAAIDTAHSQNRDAPACNLRRGVVADDSTRSLTVHLVAPDPLFLAKLTYFVVPTPPGTPLSEVDTPIVGVGPYQIAEFKQNEKVVLTRNPYFRQWSFAAQPAGYPDVIRYLPPGKDQNAVLTQVLEGKADVARISPGLATGAVATDALLRDLPSQVKTNPGWATNFIYLGNQHGVTRDVRVRRAINFAIDRRVFAELDGGPSVARPTCQLLPFAFPAYRPHCPYSVSGDTEPYGGPDLTRARALIRAAHAVGKEIGVGYRGDESFRIRLPELTRVLTAIGLRPHAVPASNGPWGRVDIDVDVDAGWIADYPDPSTFYFSQVSCAVGEIFYCNPGIESQVKAARSLANTDPGGALDAWTAIDRALTDDAAFVALDNPTRAYLVSPRVGNYQDNQVGPILSQLWVK